MKTEDFSDDGIKSWNILANKILFKNEPRLEMSIEHFSYWLFEYRFRDELKKFIDIYEDILKIYKDNIPNDNDRPFMEEHLIHIAFVLNKWGRQTEAVIYWLNVKDMSTFRNIKNLHVE